ncbi:MAG TPA: aminotransferase class IV [Polyangiaceae bacterium]
MQRIGGEGRGLSLIALVDGREASALPLDDHGVLLGDAVFETMRAYGGVVFALGDHMERLARSAAWARIALPNVEDEIASVAKRLGDGAVRAFVLRNHRVVTAEPLAIDPSIYERGVSACILPHDDFGTPESAHAKYARYLPRLLARKEAERLGCQDALLADASGRIVSAATGSVFAVTRGVLVTSSILEGITRRRVLQEARDMGMDCVLRPIEPADVEHATEMFVTSSLREIVPLARVGDKTLGPPGETTRALLRAYRDRVDLDARALR